MISEDEVVRGLTKIRELDRGTGIRIRPSSKSPPRSRSIISEMQKRRSSCSRPGWADASTRPTPPSRSSPSSPRSITIIRNGSATSLTEIAREKAGIIKPARSGRLRPATARSRGSHPCPGRGMRRAARFRQATVRATSDRAQRHPSKAKRRPRSLRAPHREDRSRRQTPSRAGSPRSSGRRAFSAGTSERSSTARTIRPARASWQRHGGKILATSKRRVMLAVLQEKDVAGICAALEPIARRWSAAGDSQRTRARARGIAPNDSRSASRYSRRGHALPSQRPGTRRGVTQRPFSSPVHCTLRAKRLPFSRVNRRRLKSVCSDVDASLNRPGDRHRTRRIAASLFPRFARDSPRVMLRCVGTMASVSRRHDHPAASPTPPRLTRSALPFRSVPFSNSADRKCHVRLWEEPER